MEDKQFRAWRRRDVLALAPAGIAAVAAVSRLAAWSVPLGLPLSAMGSAAEALRIAYVTDGYGTPGNDPKGEPPTSRLVDARALPAGDPELAAQGVRLSIRGGFDSSDAPARDLASISIDVDYRPFHNSVHHAWGFDAGPVPSMASPVRFAVPVAADTGLNLIVDVREDEAGEPRRYGVHLTTGSEPGLPKLRPGVYLLTWPHLQSGLLSAGARCYWCDQTASLVRRDWRQDRMVPARFPYLVLGVHRPIEGAA
jgi:hypothetical protein